MLRMASLTTLQNMTMESNLTMESHNTLNSLTNVKVVELFWIPVYKGIRQRESRLAFKVGAWQLRTSYIQIRECLRLQEGENYKKAWIEVRSYSQSKPFIARSNPTTGDQECCD